MKIRPRSLSTDMIDHALAAPTWRSADLSSLPPAPVAAGIGSQLHRKAPVRASNARTTPAGIAARWLSSIADPTTTRASIMAGGGGEGYAPTRSARTARGVYLPGV